MPTEGSVYRGIFVEKTVQRMDPMTGEATGPALDALAKSTLESEMSTELMIEKIRKGALRKPKFSHFSEIIQLENSPSLSLSGRLSLGKASGLSDLTKLRMEHDFRQRSQRGAKNSVIYFLFE